MTGIIAFIFLSFLYLLPAIIAYDRKHKSRDAICILNLILGWTLLGWVFALVWSFTGNVEERVV